MNLILPIALLLLPAIEEQIPEGAFVYPGAGPREVILVDPEHSPLLEKAFVGLKEQLCDDFSEYQILQTTCLYIREEIFNLDDCNEWSVQKLIQSLYPDEKEPQISLEAFLEQKTGVCRHIALTATYLIHRLIKEGWLEAEALLIRANSPYGRHAWTLVLTEAGAWHLDCLWQILENGKTSAGFSKLCHNYGKRTMDEQKKHWENRAIKPVKRVY